MTKNYISISAAALLAAAPAYGLTAPQSPAELLQSADLVVVGAASAVTQGGATINFVLKVDRTIKANLSTISSISVAWETPSAGVAENAIASTQATGGSEGIWFLRQSASGWTLLPVVQGNAPFYMVYYPVSTGPILSAYSYAAEAAGVDKLAAELGSAVEAAGSTNNPLITALQYGLLDSLNSTYVTLAYNRLSTSNLPAQQIVGLSGLIRSGSASAFSTALKSASSFAATPQQNSILLSSIRDVFRPSDTATLTAAGKAAIDSTNVALNLRQALGHVLASVHTTATLPYLAALLNDQDATIRAEGIGGIGSFANGLPGQTPANTATLAYLQFPGSAPYMTQDTKAHFALGTQAISRNEAYYLSFWNQWWEEEHATLGF